ncbi:hypothetical protein M427DRAFT_141085 [Gonapodya prolifera JEL478]|uniref:Uncharacterized protein n=1 Tax=Gonapodya prolifera (strain JEL478) TaxID=1344416 RepID=A0A138ZYU8_GONPJ|nr:hypothetical protein M427DRAFT_141085 [Gonapodya prolifera JEL478]|eukprot:KXS09303.1 hypothetical protein M427DRAFT_141085 [Gonapodya prolifera JEL478]
MVEAQRKSVRDFLQESVGFYPKDPISWLYAARGFYKIRDFHSVIEAVVPALRNERTKREAQHLLAFALLNTGQVEAAVGGFYKSVAAGNDTDWQPLVEVLIDNPSLKLT